MPLLMHWLGCMLAGLLNLAEPVQDGPEAPELMQMSVAPGLQLLYRTVQAAGWVQKVFSDMLRPVALIMAWQSLQLHSAVNLQCTLLCTSSVLQPSYQRLIPIRGSTPGPAVAVG